MRTALVVPGARTCTTADARRIDAGTRQALLRAIQQATGLDSPGATDAETDADAEETTHADRIHTLHELGYDYPAIYGLLPAEIEAASTGAKRAADRRDGGEPQPDAVESSDGTRMRGGPAEGVDRIDFVDADGNPLN